MTGGSCCVVSVIFSIKSQLEVTTSSSRDAERQGGKIKLRMFKLARQRGGRDRVEGTETERRISIQLRQTRQSNCPDLFLSYKLHINDLLLVSPYYIFVYFVCLDCAHMVVHPTAHV